MIDFILNGKSKKKSNIYKDVMEHPEKYIWTRTVEDNEEKEIVVRIKKKCTSIAKNTATILGA